MDNLRQQVYEAFSRIRANIMVQGDNAIKEMQAQWDAERPKIVEAPVEQSMQDFIREAIRSRQR